MSLTLVDAPLATVHRLTPRSRATSPAILPEGDGEVVNLRLFVALKTLAGRP